MKKFSQFINEAKLEIQDDTIGYIGSKDLQTYLTVADKFISKEAKDITRWLITNNASYISELPGADSNENALAGFFSKGMPKDEHLKELYRNINKLAKANRLLEIPVFQTKGQFDGIINQEVSPDEILLDFNSERGRNEVAKRYTPLVHKIAHSRFGKTKLTYEEIVSAGFEGLTYAMNTYGKKSNKEIKREEVTGIELDQTKKKALTFLTYASYMIFMGITEAEKNESHIVRIPTSVQNREKKENGRMIRNNTISGDESKGKNKDGGDSKAVFDTIGSDAHDAAYNLDQEDLNKLWEQVKKKLLDKFDQKTIDIFCLFYGLWSYEKMKNKDIAKKYNTVPGNITAICKKVLNFIHNDKETNDAFSEIWELMKECLHDKYAAEHDDVYIVNQNKHEQNEFMNEE